MRFDQAVNLHREGRVDEAESAYLAILRAEPSHLDALICLATLRMTQGAPVAAEALLRRAVALAPDSPEALANLAAALQARGGPGEAMAFYQRALAIRPDMTDARFGLAACLQACGRDVEAVAAYREILAAAPTHAEAHFGAGTALARIGKAGEAAAHFQAAIDLDGDFAEAHLALGRLQALDESFADAVAHFRQAVDVDPDYEEALVALGLSLSRLQQDEEAIRIFQRAQVLNPKRPDVQKGLGALLDRQKRHAEAIAHFRAALATEPNDIDAIGGLATALKNAGQHGEALSLARRALAERPEYPPTLALIGSILAEMGEIDDARTQFRRAVALKPNRPDYAYYLTELARVEAGDPVIAALEAMLERVESYPPEEQCQVHFALAKAYDDVGERERGFASLLRGAAKKRSLTAYDEAGALLLLERIAAAFSSECLASRAGVGDPSRVPVFVVGMPRSGTTLVEQVLASHPAVHGAGERTDLPRAIGRMSVQNRGSAPFPENVQALSAQSLRAMGGDYLAALRALDRNAQRIVDKLPANFVYLGLIRLILPNAKIVHVVRDPVDTCLSCFSKLFAGEQPFSYDLGELGRYYRAYRRLMDHWRAVLPADVLIDVVYENLVDDFEAQARRLIAQCELPWDPACLMFHKTDRLVRTASLAQVRKPIYRSSIGRWRPDDAALRALLDGLNDQAAVGGMPGPFAGSPSIASRAPEAKSWGSKG